MRFGLLVGTRLAGGGDPGTAVRDALAEAAAAERAGFHGVFVAEHHGALLRYLPATTPLLFLLAHATDSVDVGSSVLLLPLAQPARVAEEFALLDHVSSGRAILGLGAGYLDADFAYFGIDRARMGRRFEEGIALVRRLWSEGGVDHDGEFYATHGATLFPAPLRPGGPPIWLGGRSRPGVRRAARLADTWVLDATPRVTAFKPWHDLFEAERQGRAAQIAILRDAWLDLGTKHDATYREATLAAHRSKLAAGVYELDPELRHRAPRDVAFDDFARDRWLTGDAAAIHARLDALERDLGAGYVLVRFRDGTEPGHEAVLEQIEAFGETIVRTRGGGTPWST